MHKVYKMHRNIPVLYVYLCVVLYSVNTYTVLSTMGILTISYRFLHAKFPRDVFFLNLLLKMFFFSTNNFGVHSSFLLLDLNFNFKANC